MEYYLDFKNYSKIDNDIFNQNILEAFKKWWVSGGDISIDEQTIGFQGKKNIKIRITYKRVGNGFQSETSCD